MYQEEKSELVYKPEETEETPINLIKPADENEDTPKSKDIKIGTVVDCVKLNVRKEPVAGAEIVCEIDSQTELMIDESESTDDFFKVCMASEIEGFCMRKFIAVQP